MKILQIFPDGSLEVLLSNGSHITLTRLMSGGNRIVLDDRGEEKGGWLQKLNITSKDVYYLLIRFTENKISISLEIGEGEENNLYSYLLSDLEFMVEYGWLFAEDEGYRTAERLCQLCPDLDLIKEYFQTISRKNILDRQRRWSALQRAIDLFDNPDLRLNKENIDFWENKALPFLKILKIVND